MQAAQEALAKERTRLEGLQAELQSGRAALVAQVRWVMIVCEYDGSGGGGGDAVLKCHKKMPRSDRLLSSLSIHSHMCRRRRHISAARSRERRCLRWSHSIVVITNT